MLRETDVFDAQGFAFADLGEPKAPALVSVESTAEGATATIADAHLLFNSDFSRAGNDLHLDGHDGGRAIVRDYFASTERAALMSRDGARLSPDLVEALTKSIAPQQYAQAGTPAPAANDAVGRVVTASADSTILRNGVPVTVRPGDAVLRADVLQTAGGTMAVTFNDGSTLNLTANTRIVVSEFVYAPNGTGNSQLLDLVQGSLTFISGEVAHSGNMSIGTPVATMGIRGTVGGVTTASDGTVQFYVSQSATGAVIINAQGQIIANVVQDGPLIVVRPVGPLQVVAEEIGKTPQQLAVELQALQQIVSIKAIGDQILQQFLQPQQQTPNPQSGNGPHTQIQIDDKLKITLISTDGEGGNGTNAPATHAVIQTITNDADTPTTPITVPLPVNLPPVTFAPLTATTKEDTALVFNGGRAITIADNDSSTLTVTLSVTNGLLSLGNVSGLSFTAGDGVSDGAMTFSGSPAAVAAALSGLTFTPAQDYNGAAVLSITKSDGVAASTTTTVDINVTAVNDAPVISQSASATLAYTENDAPKAVNAALTLSDVDSTTLSGATVKITGNFHADEDVLSFTAQGVITGSYNAETGILTLSGVASLADYQAVLRSVTYENTSDDPSDDTRTIEFQVKDGSSENSASNVVTSTVAVTPVNDAPVLNFFNVNVSGDDPAVLTSSDFSVTDPDGPNVIFTVTNVTGGEFVVDSGSNNLFSTQLFQQGPVTFTAADIAAGRVSFVPDGSGDPVSYSVSVSDGIASSPVIEDHLPVAVDIKAEVTAGSAASSYNIVIILDVSGSMAGQRLIDAKAAIANLLGNDSINSVMAVSFAGSGDVFEYGNSPWVDAGDANDYFQGLTAGGGTNYVDAISDVMTAWNSNAPGGADKTLVYFISDGEPSQALDGNQTATWESFLSGKGVDASYAIGISPNVSATNLEPIAWKPGDAGFDPINLQSTTDLANTLQGTVIDTLNIFTDGDASFGSDGGRVLSIVVDGQTYTWDGLNTVSSNAPPQTWSATAASLTVTTALGGILTFYFGDEGQAHAGDWSYSPPADVDHSSVESFRYTLADNDGDQASANINVTVVDQDGPQPSADVIFTNASSFEIPDWVLLRNDNDPAHLLNIVGVGSGENSEPAVVAEHCGDQVIVEVDGSDYFYYVAADLLDQEAVATVQVASVSSLDLSASFGDLIIVADNCGTTMAGGVGANVLIGGLGNDTMTGNGNADIFVFKPDGGDDVVTDFSGHGSGGQGDVIALDGFSFSSFDELKQNASITDIETDSGAATLIDFGCGNTITLLNVESTELTAADFIFHPAQYNIG